MKVHRRSKLSDEHYYELMLKETDDEIRNLENRLYELGCVRMTYHQKLDEIRKKGAKHEAEGFKRSD